LFTTRRGAISTATSPALLTPSIRRERTPFKLAVLPEQATVGYTFDNFAMVRPYLNTVPGKTTGAKS
jgi:hypothetical protein